MRSLRGRSFAVLSTADDEGRPQSAGIVYAVARARADFYVMTRRHLHKARNVAVNPNVALVVPLSHRVLRFLPPPCIQFQGTAAVLSRDDGAGLAAFESFLLGRAILRMYRRLEQRGESRVCFLRVRPGPAMLAYAVGTPMWRLATRMDRGATRVEVPARERGELPPDAT